MLPSFCFREPSTDVSPSRISSLSRLSRLLASLEGVHPEAPFVTPATFPRLFFVDIVTTGPEFRFGIWRVLLPLWRALNPWRLEPYWPLLLMRRRAVSAIWSRTLLKSSRKITSDAHLNTRASFINKLVRLFIPHLLYVSSETYTPEWIDAAW